MLPVLFKIGTFEVHSFGVMMVLAFLSGLWLIRRRATMYEMTPNGTADLTFWVLIAGVLGARVVFILQEWSFYSTHLSELLSLQFKGLTSFGGVIFGVAVLVFWAKKSGIAFRKLADLFAPGFLLGHVIGRIGCLLNGCCFGGACPKDLAWGIHVQGSSLLHHPAQMYDSLMNLFALGMLLLYEKRPHAAGQIAGAFFVLHGLTRFIYEFWRAGTDAQVASGEASSTYWGTLPITQAQGVALGMMVIGVVMWVLFSRRSTAAQPTEAPAA